MLHHNNYKITGAKLYRNPVFLDSEFEKDLSLIKRVAGKIEKFGETGFFPTRLVFNNFIIACNCFGSEFVVKGLFLLSKPSNHDLVLTFVFSILGVKEDIYVNKDLIIKFEPTRLNSTLSRKIAEDLDEWVL